MQAWKWGILSVPALSGFAFGIQQVTASTTLTQNDNLPPQIAPVSKSSDNPTSKPNSLINNSNPKEVKQELKQNSVFEKLDDYTFKLSTPCNLGTGWILDYQIPDNRDQYPTVWYFGTAAHVVNTWKFDNKDAYGQTLPQMSHNKFREYASKTVKNKKDWWHDIMKCAINRKKQPLDLSITKRDNADKAKPSSGKTAPKHKIKTPKLFWSAVDLFTKESMPDISKFNIQENNFQDFAVIEVTFDSPEIAKEVTRDFANKYKVGLNDGIDIFNDPVDPKNTKNNNSNFYSLGYPLDKTDPLFVKNNWSGGRHNQGDVLSNDHRNNYKIPPNQKVRGLLSTTRSPWGTNGFPWGDKMYEAFGHYYYTQGTKLGAGASGSIAVDQDGKILGVRSMEGAHSLFAPLRSEEVIQGEIRTPKYDLILGATGQRGSYKEQVQKYLLKNNKQTWLSSLQSWSHTEVSSKSN